jgi:hypothetical protein
VKRWAVHWLEKLLRRWGEGPEAPERMLTTVERFAERHPQATRAAWAAFAAEHARQSYREGYRRGYEHIERDPAGWLPEIPPELIADAIDPTWRDRPVVLTRDSALVPEYVTEEEITLFELNKHLKELVDEAERAPQKPYD